MPERALASTEKSLFSLLSSRRELVLNPTLDGSPEGTRVMPPKWRTRWEACAPSCSAGISVFDLDPTSGLLTYNMKKLGRKRVPEAGLASVLVHTQGFTGLR